MIYSVIHSLGKKIFNYSITSQVLYTAIDQGAALSVQLLCYPLLVISRKALWSLCWTPISLALGNFRILEGSHFIEIPLSN